jgi:integrase
MIFKSINANQIIGLPEFLTDSVNLVVQCGESPLLVLHDNKPAFYVLPINCWDLICAGFDHGNLPAINSALQAESLGFLEASQTQPVRAAPVKKNVDSNLAFEKKNNFTELAEALLDIEWERVSRQELSASSVGIQKNRLDAHILPFFRYIPPTQVTHVDLAGFVSRLTKYGLSSTTISQYFVLVRKLLKLATRQGLLKEVPEFPKIKVLTQPRSMLSLHEYSKLARTALRMSRSKSFSPEVKSTEGQRERFWVAPRNRLLAPDMFWAIRFMANSFVRPGDLRQLKHKHVTVVRGQNVYLRMNLPETKKHDKPMVSMQAAVQVYESLLRHQRAQGFDDPEDYLFLPAEKDRNYALAVLGFWFKWVMREAGLATTDEKNRPKTLYCLRHTSIMFRLLYGQGIDMLTLARNARTSVQMIERFYASSLDGEMNVAMIQSRRSTKTIRGPVNRV